jgi:hypothetical protein
VGGDLSDGVDLHPAPVSRRRAGGGKAGQMDDLIA